MKFRIAVCDNEIEDLDRIQNLLKRYLISNDNTESEIYVFTSSEQMVKNLETEMYDLFILDIIMPEVNGIELGEVIREKDRFVPIIYTTASREYAFEAYGVQALFYIEKPIEYERFEEAMDTSLKLCQKQQSQRLLVKTKEGNFPVLAKDIMYVENVSRCAVYFLKDGRKLTGICNRRNFEDSVGAINTDEDFIQPHKSYFVNMSYIEMIRTNFMQLECGKIVPISRQRMQDVKKKYLAYMMRADN